MKIILQTSTSFKETIFLKEFFKGIFFAASLIKFNLFASTDQITEIKHAART